MNIKTFPVSISLKSLEITRIVPDGSVFELISSGFKWAEGPIWIPDEQALNFSDVVGDTIYRWNEKAGLVKFRQPSGMANGSTIDVQGRILTCEHANRRVARTEKDGTIVTLASHFEGKKLNSPNDVVVRSDGTIFFTDPPDGLTETWGIPGVKELDFQGVYRISPTGDLHLEIKDFQTPNGLAFAPGEKQLYIDDTDHMHVRVFDVNTDGSLSNGKVFAELDAALGSGWCDGLKTDMEGNVYVTGPGGIWIFSSSGKRLGVLETPETATNMNWGGEKKQDLFITTSTEDFKGSAVYRLHLNVSGNVNVLVK